MRRYACMVLCIVAAATSLGCRQASNVVPGSESSLAHLTAPPEVRETCERVTGTAVQVAGAVFGDACAPRRVRPEVARVTPSPAEEPAADFDPEGIAVEPEVARAHHAKPDPAATRPPVPEDRSPLPASRALLPGEGYVDGSSIRQRTLVGSARAASSGSQARTAGELATPGGRLVGHWRWQCDGAVSEYWFGPARAGSNEGVLVVNDVGVIHRGTYLRIHEDVAAGTVTVRSALLGGVHTFPIAHDGQRLYEKLPSQCAIEYAYVDGALQPGAVGVSQPRAPGRVAMERRGRNDRGF